MKIDPIKRFFESPSLQVLVVGSESKQRDRIIADTTHWETPVELIYAIDPKSLKEKLQSVDDFDFILVDYSAIRSKWHTFRAILEQYNIPILFLRPPKAYPSIELFGLRKNVFCIPYTDNQPKHLFCALKQFRAYLQKEKEKKNQYYSRLFENKLQEILLCPGDYNLQNKIQSLLSVMKDFYNFDYVFASYKKKNSRTVSYIYPDSSPSLCPEITLQNILIRCCEDLISGRVLSFPSELFYQDLFWFDSSNSIHQQMLNKLTDEEPYRFCTQYGIHSLIFIPITLPEGEKWVIGMADTAPGKVTKTLCDFIVDKLPTLSRAILTITQLAHQMELLRLFQLSTENTRIGVWEYEVETRRIISSGLASLFVEVNVPKTLEDWWQYIHPDDRLLFWERVKPCLKGLTNTFTVDHRVVLPENDVRWIRTVGECIERHGKKAERLVGLGLDITPFITLGEELKHVKESLAILSELGQIGLWTWDILQNRYILNETAVEILGIPRRESYHLDDWLEHIYPADREPVRRELGEAIHRGEGSLNVQYRVLYRGSTLRWIQSEGRVSGRDSAGNPTRFSGTHIDITQRKEMERLLWMEVMVNSRYAGLARALLKIRSIEEASHSVCLTGLDILRCEYFFVGWRPVESEDVFVRGVDKTRRNLFTLTTTMTKLTEEVKILQQPLTAGIPLVIKEPEEKIILFNKIKVGNLFFYPSFTPSHELVFVLCVNVEESQLNMELELVEWLSSTFAQAVERIRLEEAISHREAELEKTVQQLQNALATVRKLEGLLPICARCKRIRDDKGYWKEVEVYIKERASVDFTHGICPQCAKELYGDFIA